jgi:transcriptional regulator with XRE-family HTH domain
MNQTFDFYNSRFVNGERVVQAREMACMTQVELARLVSVTQPMIAHLEKGLKQPSMDLAEAIARETKVSIDFLCQPSGVALPEGSMFRAKTAVSAKKLLQAHSMAERAFEMFLKLSTHFNLPSSRLRACLRTSRFHTSFELLRRLVVLSYLFQSLKGEKPLRFGRVRDP